MASISASSTASASSTVSNKCCNKLAPAPPLVNCVHYKPVAPVMASSASSPPPELTFKRTFYRRTLPDSCVAFSSPRGKKYFASALLNGGLKSFFALMEQHTTQSEPAYCGISTLVIILNAFAVDPRRTWKGPWRWYEESMLNCCLDLEEVKKSGITLSDFNCLAICQGLKTEVHYVDSPDSALEDFRRSVQKACVEGDEENGNGGGGDDDDEKGGRIRELLVVSYNRKVVGQTGTGHFSPLAAYDAESDSVLILDTARFKYGAHWIKLPLVYEAMRSEDPDTGRSRGYVMLSYQYDDDDEDSVQHHSAPLPSSILLRSKMSQHPVRREFKRYLQSRPKDRGELTWEEVVAYWTKDCTQPKYVFQMAEPQLKPCPDERDTMDKITNVRALISDLMPSDACFPCIKVTCGDNHGRSLDLHPSEVVFLVYLATMDKDRRTSIIFDKKKAKSPSIAVSDAVREQLLAEAELVHYAIETSDQSERYNDNDNDNKDSVAQQQQQQQQQQQEKKAAAT